MGNEYKDVSFASFGINPRVIGFNNQVQETYDKRMAEIKVQGRSGDLIARNGNRVNLFRAAHAETSFEDGNVEKDHNLSPKKKSETQKNRSGRVVKQSMAIHFAHILLSTDNQNLMAPPVPHKHRKDIIIYPKHDVEYTRTRHLIKKKLKQKRGRKGKTEENGNTKPCSSTSTSSTSSSIVPGKLESSDNESEYGSESSHSTEWS